jgi:Fic family protein
MSFDPTYPHPLAPLPPKGISNSDFYELLLPARVALAELKGACSEMPNPMLLMAPIMVRESVASSNIENINTTLADVLQGQLFPEAEQRQPDKEVLRYRAAMSWGFENLEKIPISTRMIIGIQSILIPDGNGNFRREQNQIANLTTLQPLYTPPPAQDVNKLINNWEVFVNNTDNSLDPLIKAIIAHYQFEAIHPFRDGNGRTGRILMILQLIQSGLLDYPVLYISSFINEHRNLYYESLLNVTIQNDLKNYINYMLNGFFNQATATRATLAQMNSLFQTIRDQVKRENSKIFSVELIEAIFSTPILTPTVLAEKIGIHYTTASRHLKILEDMGILRAAWVGKHHLFANHQLMELLK